ncbi:MAG: sensor histidine kinase [Blautia sp.]
MEVAMNFPKTLFLSLVILFLLVIGWLGYRYYRKMKVLAEAICDLSSGKEVQLSENGSTGEIAHSINETSDRLQKQMEMLRKRDAARTQWISGVSHDIRTPLSLILGYSNLLEEKQQSREEIQREAGLIRQESLRIRDLIEDLNLTSKLEYHMQPLRVGRTAPVKILRKVMADVMNSIAMDQGKYEIRVKISEEFERQQVNLDEKLVERAFRNVVENAIYHNEKGCGITVEPECLGNS